MLDTQSLTTHEQKIRRAILTSDSADLQYFLRSYTQIEHPKELLQIALQSRNEDAAKELTLFFSKRC